MSEETPLLLDATKLSPYLRFSPSRKRLIVVIVSCGGLLTPFVVRCFIPSIPKVAEEFHSSAAIVNLAVSLPILAAAIGCSVWATYSCFYGRRPIYLGSLGTLCLGCLGVILSRTIPQLVVFRILQVFGASSGISVGTGIIADIYALEERGTAMGIFYTAFVLGPTLAPFAGGIATHYFTWRLLQFGLMVFSFLWCVVAFFLLPETSHVGSRGMDQIVGEDLARKTVKLVWLNPLKSLWLLRSPNVMAVTLAGSFAVLTDFVLLSPIAYTIGKRYNITNEALIGALCIPAGIGNMIGSSMSGRLSDSVVIRWRNKRGGKWVPEDRLRAALFGAGILVPFSVLLCGFVTRFIADAPGIALSLTCTFMNGIGVYFVMAPTAVYGTDVLHSRSAEVAAANLLVRGVVLAIAVSCVLPLIEAFGVFWTNFLAAIFAWFGFALLYITIKYGDRMRAYVNVGFTTNPDA